jgi:hypothetical protein
MLLCFLERGNGSSFDGWLTYLAVKQLFFHFWWSASGFMGISSLSLCLCSQNECSSLNYNTRGRRNCNFSVKTNLATTLVTSACSFHGNKTWASRRATKLLWPKERQRNASFCCNLSCTRLLPTSWRGLVTNLATGSLTHTCNNSCNKNRPLAQGNSC